MTPLDEARRWCRELGGPELDRFTLPAEAVARHERTGRPLRDAARDVVSGALAARAAAGSRPDRDRLVGLWLPEVVRWCRWGAARGVDADDAAHEVMVRALAGLARLPDPTGFRPWLWGICWRVLREQERRGWLRRWLGAPAESASPEPLAPDVIELSERDAQVQAVLRDLDLPDRQLLWLAYVDGRTRADIAEVLGMPVGTLNRRLTRARQRFAARAAARGIAPDPAPARQGEREVDG